MECQNCESTRIAIISAKCSDLCNVIISEPYKEHDGYLPDDMGIGGGDYIEFEYCLNCGQIQGEFPVNAEEMFEDDDDDSDEDW